MKKRIGLGLVVMLVVVMVLGTAGAIGAKSMRTDVSSLEYDCFTGFAEGGGMEQKGDILHIRDILHTNVNFSDTPELQGIHSNVANGTINMATGQVSVRGKSVWVPDGIDGAWVGHWTWIANSSQNKTWGILRGTGELKGKMLFIDVYDEPDPPPLPGVCDEICAGKDPESCYYEAAVRAEGYILEMGVLPAEQLPVSLD